MGLMQRRDFNQTAQRQRVAIAGFGLEGRAILDYLQPRGGDLDITILDEAQVDVPEGVKSDLRPDVFDGELDYDVVWRASPAIAPRRLKTSAPVMTMTGEFLARCPAPVIGVTGTKGKGTTAALIAKILESAGPKTHLVGNIGVPALSVLSDIKDGELVVFELSSFQLWDAKASPPVAVVLMIEPDHLDVHKDINDYVQAKSNIARWQGEGGVVIYHPDNPLTAKAAEVGLGRKIKYLTSQGCYIRNGQLVIDEQNICSTKELGLLGEHNLANAAAAVTAAWQFTQDITSVASALKTFTGLPHRLQIIASKHQVDYVDDSISTTPSSAIAALNTFADRPTVIILGGSDKGADFTPLAEQLAGMGTATAKALLMGDTTGKLRVVLDKAGFKDYEAIAGGMATVVKRASQLARPGGVVLLSPACASFDMFKDYQDRAQQFKAAVDKL